FPTRRADKGVAISFLMPFFVLAIFGRSAFPRFPATLLHSPISRLCGAVRELVSRFARMRPLSAARHQSPPLRNFLRPWISPENVPFKVSALWRTSEFCCAIANRSLLPCQTHH